MWSLRSDGIEGRGAPVLLTLGRGGDRGNRVSATTSLRLACTRSGQDEVDDAHPRAEQEQTMSDTEPTRHETGEAATEAARNVDDEVTSWEYSAETGTIGDSLDDGLEEAGVEVDGAERQRLVEEIDEVKDDEASGSPEVDRARPRDDA